MTHKQYLAFLLGVIVPVQVGTAVLAANEMDALVAVGLGSAVAYGLAVPATLRTARAHRAEHDRTAGETPQK
ncbi:hypothetical protein [Streptomyces luteireticuli]|uniref:hypothetical protein n=1 Tax=Streptomyces luteireticuli TaxID=173858 RepID=UPI003557E9C0